MHQRQTGPCFADLWASHKVDTQDVDFFIRRWFAEQYTQRTPKEMIPLSDYLGLSSEEYSSWVDDKRPLEDILRSRSRMTPIPPTERCVTHHDQDTDDEPPPSEDYYD